MERVDTNDHHPFYNRRAYHGSPFYELRRLTVAKDVMVVPHKELHANLQPPKKPTKRLADGIVDYLQHHRSEGQFEPIYYTIDYLTKLATDEALGLADHLHAQMEFFE